jgi:hypothetical protein
MVHAAGGTEGLTQNFCETCPDNSIVINNACVSCPAGLSADAHHLTCLSGCAGNQTLVNGACLPCTGGWIAESTTIVGQGGLISKTCTCPAGMQQTSFGCSTNTQLQEDAALTRQKVEPTASIPTNARFVPNVATFSCPPGSASYTGRFSSGCISLAWISKHPPKLSTLEGEVKTETGQQVKIKTNTPATGGATTVKPTIENKPSTLRTDKPTIEVNKPSTLKTDKPTIEVNKPSTLKTEEPTIKKPGKTEMPMIQQNKQTGQSQGSAQEMLIKQNNPPPPKVIVPPKPLLMQPPHPLNKP